MQATIHNTTRRPLRRALLRNAVAAVIEGEGMTAGEVSAVYCGSRLSRRINREHLQHDWPTDTVSFPYGSGGVVEGEFYICLDVIEENARRFGTDFDAELLRVTIHSVLHLAGYDDHSPQDRSRMTRKEDHYLRQLFRP
ncbi:rRNA maturation RNase YbeY [Chlorobium sp. N1]|uniref:rRNA maturation RNase YbeY n=1 Tax=Chlorobium sp. N1 TaxID=2491138 RepID=UPI00103EE23D|nr:rRNA maturation RNase YbeY [Chlorobium sp. N1]TCD48950.1 rRNA maturation RNase YbeY [Chlorobium sp. N1]